MPLGLIMLPKIAIDYLTKPPVSSMSNLHLSFWSG